MQETFNWARRIENLQCIFKLRHEREVALDNLHFKGTKLEKLGVSKQKVIKLNNQII